MVLHSLAFSAGSHANAHKDEPDLEDRQIYTLVKIWPRTDEACLTYPWLAPCRVGHGIQSAGATLGVIDYVKIGLLAEHVPVICDLHLDAVGTVQGTAHSGYVYVCGVHYIRLLLIRHRVFYLVE